jgi:hypothetical protein
MYILAVVSVHGQLPPFFLDMLWGKYIMAEELLTLWEPEAKRVKVK